MLLSWGQKKATPKLELLSILGPPLAVVPPGRTFVRHLPPRPSASHHFNKQCRADLSWWLEFGISLGGVSIWPPLDPSVTCFTDASGTWGCRAILGERPFYWLQLAWPAHWSSYHITAKELVPVVIAIGVWGPQWAGCRVLFRSDNQVVVASVNSGSSWDHTLAHLLRCLFFFSASWQFTRSLELCRRCTFIGDRASALQLLVPHANPTPSPIPSTLQDLLTPVTGTGGSGPLCPRHRRQHNEDIRLWEATFPHVMQGRRFDTSPLPLTEDVLCLFVAHLMQEHLQFTSIHTYLSTVRHLQITAGIPDPFTPNALPRLSYVLVSLSLPRYSPFSTIHGRAPTRHRNPTQPVALDSLASSGWVNSQILSVSTISLKPRMTPQTTCGFPRPTLSVEGFMSIWAERLHSSAQFYFSVL